MREETIYTGTKEEILIKIKEFHGDLTCEVGHLGTIEDQLDTVNFGYLHIWFWVDEPMRYKDDHVPTYIRTLKGMHLCISNKEVEQFTK